ncbi:Lateral organ boundaries domain containing protein [Parasponia andersonii]|uniref:Lateral organ boundaries domain containing protein n=1 Tax=Parasponia andersonii TaxID=3476 RepID=A0A2P5BAL0_PARAD|nr:Lateral organ boundaries domain containing protein [Parasponia andersonii]
MTGFGSSCGACKFLRRKCSSECIFAPYFSYDEAASHFAAVHKVFGASNVSKLLLHLPLHNRSDAATTISYEALARMRDPIYGCVAHIFALQQQVAYLQEEIEILGNQIANNVTAGLASCGSSEATNNNNNNNNSNSLNSGSQLFSEHVVLNSQYYQNQQEVLLSQIQNSTGSFSNQVFDEQMGVQLLQPPYGWGDEENVVCNSLSDPLERFFEGIQQENSANNPWSDERPFVENCIGQIWE